jgi:hypothetical protein
MSDLSAFDQPRGERRLRSGIADDQVRCGLPSTSGKVGWRWLRRAERMRVVNADQLLLRALNGANSAQHGILRHDEMRLWRRGAIRHRHVASDVENIAALPAAEQAADFVRRAALRLDTKRRPHGSWQVQR